MGSSAVWSLGVATFAAALVEMVEAFTIVLAMGMTRGWRSTLWGAGAALVALAGFTAAAGYALATWLPEAALQLVIGGLLLMQPGYLAPLFTDPRGQFILLAAAACLAAAGLTMRQMMRSVSTL